jgi:hypothetical protein
MISWMFKTVGMVAREIVDAGEALIEDVSSIPDQIEKGYKEGLFSSNESKKTDNESPKKESSKPEESSS